MTSLYMLLLKFLTILTFIVIMIDETNCKALTNSTITTPKEFRSGKWFSWKFCGKLGDICKPASRKHCCSVGFTCVMKKWQKPFKLRRKPFGKCMPVPTASLNIGDVVILSGQSG